MPARMRMAVYALVCIVLGACDESPTETQPDRPAVLVYGTVARLNGSPVPNATVIVTSHDAACAVPARSDHLSEDFADSTKTDGNGNFRLFLLAPRAGSGCNLTARVVLPAGVDLLIPGETGALSAHGDGVVVFSKPVSDTINVDFELTEPRRHSIGDVIFISGCPWRGLKPAAPHVLVDVAFRDKPDAEDRIAYLQARGADIIHVFNAPVIRVDVPTDSIPSIAPDSLATQIAADSIINVLTVPDPARRDVQLILTYSREPVAADAKQLEALGARLVFRRSPAFGFVIEASDDIVPSLRALPGISDVTVATTFCVST